MRVNEVCRAAESPISCWSAAEVLDVPYADRAVLRAVTCQLGPGKWQVLVLYLDATGGEVISSIVSKTAAEAREIAASELDKCIRDPLG
jgi:hypothetical protein